MKKKSINGLGIIFAIIAAVIMIVIKYNASSEDSVIMRIASGFFALLYAVIGGALIALVFLLALYGSLTLLDQIYDENSEKGQKIHSLIDGLWQYYDSVMLLFFIVLYVLIILNKGITLIPYTW